MASSFLNSKADPNFGNNYVSKNSMLQPIKSFGIKRRFSTLSRNVSDVGGMAGRLDIDLMNCKPFESSRRMSQIDKVNNPFHTNNQNQMNNLQLNKGIVIQLTHYLYVYVIKY